MPALFQGSKRIALSRIPAWLRPDVDDLMQYLNADEAGKGSWLMTGEITPFFTLHRTKGQNAAYVVVATHPDMEDGQDGGDLVYCTKCEKVDAFFAGQVEQCFHCGAE